MLAKAEARRVRTVTLSDIEMRRDFQAIIADWRERAKKYLSTYSEYGRTTTTVKAYLLHTLDSNGRGRCRKFSGVGRCTTSGTEGLCYLTRSENR